jgi:hypothetical protein
VYGPDDAVCDRCREGKHGCYWDRVSRKGKVPRATKRKTKKGPEPREMRARESKSAANDRIKAREYVGAPPPRPGSSSERLETTTQLESRLMGAREYRRDLGLQDAFDQVSYWESRIQYDQEMLETAQKFRDRKLRERELQ